MKLHKKILVLLGFDVVIDFEYIFEDKRIIQRGKKQILQELIEDTYAGGGGWYDIKEVTL